jgi:hypothetical protein
LSDHFSNAIGPDRSSALASNRADPKQGVPVALVVLQARESGNSWTVVNAKKALFVCRKLGIFNPGGTARYEEQKNRLVPFSRWFRQVRTRPSDFGRQKLDGLRYKFVPERFHSRSAPRFDASFCKVSGLRSRGSSRTRVSETELNTRPTCTFAFERYFSESLQSSNNPLIAVSR